jgi:hypothetical protein
MKIESVPPVDSQSVCALTTTIIAYDDGVPSANSALLEEPQTRSSKRSGVLPQLMLASSLTLILTTQSLTLADILVSNPTRLPSLDQLEYRSFEKSPQITLRDARKMALQVHHDFEESLRNDRILEDRLINLAQENNET